MSEYQYYDFRAMDRALTKAEMAELRSISTRAVITSTSFTNHYEWGDLKANPLKLLEKYFDAFVYVANWGTREFYLRLPLELVDYKQLKVMLPGDAASVRKAGRHVIVGFENESEQNDWDDGTGWMGTLMSLRSELLHGDLRCLYLGWLLCVQCEEFAGEELEPLVPAGLGELPAPLHSLIEFLGIDEDLDEFASLTSAPLNAGPGRKELDAWIRSLPEREKSNLLVSAIAEPGNAGETNFCGGFSSKVSCTTPTYASRSNGVQPQRSWQLHMRARGRESGCWTQSEMRKQSGRKQRPRQTAHGIWTNWRSAKKRLGIRLRRTVQKRQPNEYDKAVSLLVDLHDLAVRKQQLSEFQSALEILRRTHAAKESFLRRLSKAML